MRELVIEKLGGTCLESPEARDMSARLVASSAGEGSVVVVVSAMGRLGNPYATDSLLALVSTGDIPARDRDLLVSVGEVVSAVVFSAHLRMHGLDAHPLTGPDAGVIAGRGYGRARVVRVEIGRLQSLLERGAVPVVAGFQGRSADGAVVTLGRGGSDTTAAVLGAALGAARVGLVKTVGGIIDPSGRIIPHLTYDAARGVTAAGAKVVSREAVEAARAAGLPLWVRPLDGTPGGGTWISDGRVTADGKDLG